MHRYPILAMNELVLSLLKEHEGGKKFFDALDEEIRFNSNFLHWAGTTLNKYLHPDDLIIVTGKFGVIFEKFLREYNVYTFNRRMYIERFPGGLRNNKFTDPLYYLRNFSGNSAVFIDDSLYSRGTRNNIQKALDPYDIKIKNSIILYDGSKEKDESLISLYQYYEK